MAGTVWTGTTLGYLYRGRERKELLNEDEAGGVLSPFLLSSSHIEEVCVCVYVSLVMIDSL